jgi:hypothetical protein
MGWFDYHLWEFTVGKQRCGLATDEDWESSPRLMAGKVRLRDILKPGKTVIDYTYDFGDQCEHRLTVIDVRAGEPGGSYPRCIGGERNGPPEDCGGIPGFYGSKVFQTRPMRAMRRPKNGRTNTIQMRSMSCRSSTLSAASPTGGTLPEYASPKVYNQTERTKQLAGMIMKAPVGGAAVLPF